MGEGEEIPPGRTSQYDQGEVGVMKLLVLGIISAEFQAILDAKGIERVEPEGQVKTIEDILEPPGIPESPEFHNPVYIRSFPKRDNSSNRELARRGRKR